MRITLSLSSMGAQSSLPFTGSIFGDCCQSGVPTHDFATFVATDGDVITSVVLTDDGTAAFEYSNVGATPIPGALPLFVGGLGLLGLVSLRRKQKGSPVAFAAGFIVRANLSLCERPPRGGIFFVEPTGLNDPCRSKEVIGAHARGQRDHGNSSAIT